MTEPERISVQETRRKLLGGDDVLLVCAYEDEKSFVLSRLEGAISLPDFLSRRESLPRDRELVFY